MRIDDDFEGIEYQLTQFNAGPTNGTLNDKRRMALIYEELLTIKALLSSTEK